MELLKIKIETPFWLNERVVINTNPDEPISGTITEVLVSDNGYIYTVSYGNDDKKCYASELELIGERKKKNEK